MKFGLRSAITGAVGTVLLAAAPVSATDSVSASSDVVVSGTAVSVAAAEVAAIAAPVRAAIAQYAATASTLQLQNAIVAAIPAGSDPVAVGMALNTVASEFAGSPTVITALTGAAMQGEILPVLSTLPAGAVVIGGLVIVGGVVVGIQALDDDSDY